MSHVTVKVERRDMVVTETVKFHVSFWAGNRYYGLSREAAGIASIAVGNNLIDVTFEKPLPERPAQLAPVTAWYIWAQDTARILNTRTQQVLDEIEKVEDFSITIDAHNGGYAPVLLCQISD